VIAVVAISLTRVLPESVKVLAAKLAAMRRTRASHPGFTSLAHPWIDGKIEKRL